jgi:hypothetical protein
MILSSARAHNRAVPMSPSEQEFAMSHRHDPDSPENLVYRDELTGELRQLDDALETTMLNALSYERDMELIATYGMEEPREVDGRWPL